MIGLFRGLLCLCIRYCDASSLDWLCVGSGYNIQLRSVHCHDNTTPFCSVCVACGAHFSSFQNRTQLQCARNRWTLPTVLVHRQRWWLSGGLSARNGCNCGYSGRCSDCHCCHGGGTGSRYLPPVQVRQCRCVDGEHDVCVGGGVVQHARPSSHTTSELLL